MVQPRKGGETAAEPCVQLTTAELEGAKPFGSTSNALEPMYAKFSLSGMLIVDDGQWSPLSPPDIAHYETLDRARADSIEHSTWQVPENRPAAAKDPTAPQPTSDMLQLDVAYADGSRRSRRIPFDESAIADGSGSGSILYFTTAVLRPEMTRIQVLLRDRVVGDFARPAPALTVQALVLASTPRRVAMRVSGPLKYPVHVKLLRERDGTFARVPVDMRTLVKPSDSGMSPCWLLMPRTDSKLEGPYVLEVYDWFGAWTGRNDFDTD